MAASADEGTAPGPRTPIRVDIAMFGGERAGKTSLLASMYTSVLAEVRAAGLAIRRSGAGTIHTLDEAYDALERLPEHVRLDPTLSNLGVSSTPTGTSRVFDFVVHGAGVDVATLSFADFSGEDIVAMAAHVLDTLRGAEIVLIAINTPALMQAHEDAAYLPLHLRANVPDQLNEILATWSGPAPLLVMFCPIKAEAWLHSEQGSAQLLGAVEQAYSQTLNLLARKTFETTTVVITPVETVGSVEFDGLRTYNEALPPSHTNVVYTWRAAARSWAPRYHEQPFRWALLAVTRAVDYGTLHLGAGGKGWQRLLARVGQAYVRTGLPKIASVERFWSDSTGLSDFRAATARLAENIATEAPCRLVQSGDLLKPVG
ncbi:MAG: hypothetical protein ACT4PP_00980 [Sporichthyaceae bacterium]